MAFGRIEQSGCGVHKGKVKVRFNFYLEPGDARYHEHHIEISPGEWRDNPFHNHFEYFDPDVTDDEINQRLNERLEEFFGIWSRRGDILREWKRQRKTHVDLSLERLKKCKDRVDRLLGVR